MEKFKSDSTGYNVLPIKVKDFNHAYAEICSSSFKRDGIMPDCIVINPVIAKDSLDIKEPISVLNVNETLELVQISGSYIANESYCIKDGQNGETENQCSILTVDIACLKSVVTMKHIDMSTLIATTDLFKKYSVVNESHPYIIINTKCDANTAPLNSFSDIIREITLSYINCYGEYPTIFVAFSDNDTLTTSDDIKKDKKKKKKKKNKKK